APARKSVYDILLAPRNVKFVPIGVPGQAIEGKRHPQDLHLPGWLGRNVINEHVLIRLLRSQISARVITNVVTAGENQKGLAIRAGGRAHSLTHGKLGRAGEVRV